jgi:hypothetical protein
MKKIIYLLALPFLVSCGMLSPVGNVPTKPAKVDTVFVPVVKVDTVYKKDTVTVQCPVKPIDTVLGGRLSAFSGWQSNGAVNAGDKILPGNSPEQNSAALKELYRNYNFVYLPAGDYYFSETIQPNKTFALFGDPGSYFNTAGTRLHFPPATHGIRVTHPETILQNLVLFGNRNVTGQYFGVYSSAHINAYGVYAKGWADNGWLIYGNLEEGTDISGSLLIRCGASENGADGLFVGKVDGNGCTVVGFDARDNARYGIQDDSFLGNYFIGCMAHNNVKGHYYVRDKNNARSSFIACYAESDGPPSSFSQLTTVVGGFLANGYDKHDGRGVIQP